MTDKRCTFKRGQWNCGSYQFNLYKDDIDQGDLCDVHYWQTRAQPAQEPVALVIDGVLVKSALPEKYTGHLYTYPPKREWVGLTDEDRKAALLTAYKEWECEELLLCAREDYLLIEQALKEKNNG
jgi:hypothetical protein